MEEAAIESGDSFVVEFQDPTTREWLTKKEEPQAPEPLFKSNESFFNRMSASTSSLFSGSNSTATNDKVKSAVDKKLMVTAKEKVKEKDQWIEPGTLGLGNM